MNARTYMHSFTKPPAAANLLSLDYWQKHSGIKRPGGRAKPPKHLQRLPTARRWSSWENNKCNQWSFSGTKYAQSKTLRYGWQIMATGEILLAQVKCIFMLLHQWANQNKRKTWTVQM